MRFCVFLVTDKQIFFWGSSSENSFLVCMCTWFFFSVLILLFQIARMLPHNTYFLQYHVPFRHCKNECQERKCSCSFEHLCFYCCNKSQAGRKKEKILLKCNFFYETESLLCVCHYLLSDVKGYLKPRWNLCHHGMVVSDTIAEWRHAYFWCWAFTVPSACRGKYGWSTSLQSEEKKSAKKGTSLF